MTWADRRKHVIEAILVVCGIAIVAVVVIAVTYRTPSCTDGKENQGEQGIDCGGPCPYACDFTESAPLVHFIQTVSPEPGRTDVIAYIDNSNSDVELMNAPYTITLYDSQNTVIAHRAGTLTIPPSTTYPLYLPDFYNGSQKVTQAFLTFDSKPYIWLRTTTKPVVPAPQGTLVTQGTQPRITSTLTNTTGQTLYSLTIVAVVFDAANNVIAASQTLVPQIPSQGSAPIVFTWNQPFAGTEARVEILPVPSS